MGEAMDNPEACECTEAICEICGKTASECRCGEGDDFF